MEILDGYNSEHFLHSSNVLLHLSCFCTSIKSQNLEVIVGPHWGLILVESDKMITNLFSLMLRLQQYA
jgi:hypothetical protein